MKLWSYISEGDVMVGLHGPGSVYASMNSVVDSDRLHSQQTRKTRKISL